MKLKPCPFCGSELQLVRDYRDSSDYACPTSQYECPVGQRRINTDDAEKWNTRPIEDKQAEQIAELVEEIGNQETRLKEELRHAYGEDKLDDFPKADEADEALDNLKQALAATPQKEESDG